MLGCVLAGMGAALVPRSVISSFPEKKRLRINPLPKDQKPDSHHADLAEGRQDAKGGSVGQYSARAATAVRAPGGWVLENLEHVYQHPGGRALANADGDDAVQPLVFAGRRLELHSPRK